MKLKSILDQSREKKATDASLFKWQCKNNYKQKASLKIYTKN